MSRTFAVTIPLLPTEVRYVIGNAYLLCRIADTIEDEPTLADEFKRVFLSRFIEVVQNGAATVTFAHDLSSLLTEATPKSEQDLVEHVGMVIDFHMNLPDGQRKPINRCIETMCTGMTEFIGTDSTGLPTMWHVERYCYFVAGVVGEMITDVLCDYSHLIDKRRADLAKLSVQFGRGLQLVNILKDHREDRRRGTTWLPRQIHPTRIHSDGEWDEQDLTETVIHVAKTARRDLRAALRYVLLIPEHETRVRHFLAVTLGLAVLTLRRIHAKPDFQHGDDVKISRSQVYATVAATKLAVRSDLVLERLFNCVTPR